MVVVCLITELRFSKSNWPVVYPIGFNKEEISRSLRDFSKEGRATKKCSISSIPEWAQCVYAVSEVMLEFLKV